MSDVSDDNLHASVSEIGVPKLRLTGLSRDWGNADQVTGQNTATSAGDRGPGSWRVFVQLLDAKLESLDLPTTPDLSVFCCASILYAGGGHSDEDAHYLVDHAVGAVVKGHVSSLCSIEPQQLSKKSHKTMSPTWNQGR